MGDDFAETSMSAAEFKAAFEEEVLSNYAGGWTLFAETAGGYRPVGLILGFWSHPNPAKAPFMIIGDMIWFPWTSARNRIAAAVNFFNVMRDQIPMVDYARDKDKAWWETICQHGIMRRVGTSFVVYQGEQVAVFETRRRVG